MTDVCGGDEEVMVLKGSSGDEEEEGGMKEGGMLLYWSGETCLQESLNWDLNARRDRAMQRWGWSFQAAGLIRVKVRGQSMHGVCQQGGGVAGSAVSKGRAEGGEVRENSSG